MNYLKSTWNFIQKNAIYILVVVLILFFLDCSNNASEKKRQQNNMEALNAELVISTSKLGQEVSSKSVLEVTLKELKDQYWIKDDSLQDLLRKYRKVNVAAIIKTETYIPSFQSDFETGIPGESFMRRWKKEDQWYSISGVVTNDFVRVDTLQMNNAQRLVIGTEKGFFNNTLTASVTNSNPYFKTTDLTTQVITQRNKRFGVGFFAGVDILGKPTFGVGLNYSLFRF